MSFFLTRPIVFLDLPCSILCSFISFAFASLSKTKKSSPASDTPVKPIISTGIEGLASLTNSPLKLFMALIFPHCKPLAKKSPLFKVPLVIKIVDTGPLPLSNFDSITIPWAGTFGFVL